MIDGFYREEARLQENSSRLKATQNTAVPLVEVSEMAAEEDQEVLKPESDEEVPSPTRSSHIRRFGRRRRRLKGTASPESKRRRHYKKRNRVDLLISPTSQPLYHKRQRRIPREFDDYESFCTRPHLSQSPLVPHLTSPRLITMF